MGSKCYEEFKLAIEEQTEEEIMARFNEFKTNELRQFVKDNSDLTVPEIVKAWNTNHPDEHIAASKIYSMQYNDRKSGKTAKEKPVGRKPGKPASEKKGKISGAPVCEEYTFAGLAAMIECVQDYAKKLQAQQAEKAKALFLA